MRRPSAITIAMLQPNNINSWEAQIHIEWKNSDVRDVLPLSGDTPMQILERAKVVIERKLDKEFLRGN